MLTQTQFLIQSLLRNLTLLTRTSLALSSLIIRVYVQQIFYDKFLVLCRHSGRHNNSKRSKYFFVDQYKRPKILPTFFMTKCTCYGSFWTEGEVDYTDERIKFVINLLVYRLYPALSFLPKN
jgi:Gpi18-like mannosyltransferase